LSQSLERCYKLDDSLTKLARKNPDTKFLRCKASALGFASQGTSRSKISVSHPPRRTHDADEDDPYGDDDENAQYSDEEDEDSEEDVDLDMLPTMLVYRDGQLVHNWVRVDWEAGEGGIEELLGKHNILPQYGSIFDELGIRSDGEDGDDFDETDFNWNDSDDD
jgi:hypothetical protein